MIIFVCAIHIKFKSNTVARIIGLYCFMSIYDESSMINTTFGSERFKLKNTECILYNF